MTTRKNPHAVALGKRGGKASAGTPKRFTLEERERRRERMKAYNAARKAATAPDPDWEHDPQ